MARLKCENCKKIVDWQDRGQQNLKKDYLPPKFCSWCKQHISSRQGKKSQSEKKK